MPKLESINELERVLARKKERLKLLQKRRDKLSSQIARIDKEVESLVGKPAAPRKVRRRRRGAKSLQQFVLDALKASPQPKTAMEIAQAVTQAGYSSKSKDLVSLVRQVCYRSDLIRTKERGKFAPASRTGAPRRVVKTKKAATK